MLKHVFSVGRRLKREFFHAKYRRAFVGQDFDPTLRCDNFRNFRFGRSCYVGPYCHFDALGGIEFEDFVIVGPHVRIWSYNHNFRSEMIPYGPGNELRPVKIGMGCWIGLQALILPGTDIGEGSIVAAGSIVRGQIPPFSMVRPQYSGCQPLEIRKNRDLYYRDQR
jgi:acetyltransferase-like isoleucine patch superfamily enzyme